MSDDIEVQRAMAVVPGTAIEQAQQIAGSLAVKALIATHPNPQEFREVFAQMVAQFQSAPVYLEAMPEMRVLLRHFAEHLLQQAPTPGASNQG